jgi:eukaryotic-like serine/threonine-protein kinase
MVEPADAMPLTTGTRLGPYEILSTLGAGGMGEVYRARDTSLRRDVAIKILPAVWAADPDRLQRFEREAQLLASLNHPHIGAIYGLESTSAQRALVLELVEGPTLAERIAHGPIPLPGALSIAKQIADALGAAHEQGIVHRDLKPANIKLTALGSVSPADDAWTVKVLDFGLAKMGPVDAAEGWSQDRFANSPTITVMPTGAGVLLGTAPYMSPEQARGQAVDRRSDVWAFGCVLYEMLTGECAFGGATTSDTIAAILGRPPDWARLPAATPPAVRRLLQRCLDKDHRRRLRDMADAQLDIDEGLAPHAEVLEGAEQPRRAGGLSTWLWMSAVVLAAVAAGAVVWTMKPVPTIEQPAGVTRLTIVPPEPLPIDGEGGITVSPDGRRVAYVAGPARRVYVRDLDQFDSRVIAGTEGAQSPSFSPDNQWLAFAVAGSIKKVSRDGSVALVLCDPCQGGARNLSWGTDDAIYYGAGPSGIWRVSPAGGASVAATALREGETAHGFPILLSDRKRVLFQSQGEVSVQSLSGGQRATIGAGVSAGALPTGHLVYLQAGTVFAVPFDAGRFDATGPAIALLQNVEQLARDAPQFSVSPTGTLAYVPVSGADPGETLVWVDRAGVEQPSGLAGRLMTTPRLAPDGKRLAVIRGREALSGGGDIWLYDLERGTSTRVTTDRGALPVWSPDGRQLSFNKAGPDAVFTRSFDGSGREEQFIAGITGGIRPMSWSSDGRVLMFVSVNQATANDIMFVDRQDPAKAKPFVQTAFREGAPTFSPDGHWIAYVSDKSGRDEIYLRPFPGPGEDVTVSAEGGIEPAWARGTGELFYRQGDAVMAVEVKTAPALQVGKPRRLFAGHYSRVGGVFANYDVTADGQRFLMVRSGNQEAATRINVVINWFEDVKRLLTAH